MEIALIIVSVVVVALVAALVYLILKAHKRPSEADVQLRIFSLEKDLEYAQAAAAKALSEQQEHSNILLKEQQERFSALLKQQEEHNAASVRLLKERFDETLANLQTSLKGVTEELLKQREAAFTESSKQSLDTLLTPLKTELANMQKSMTEGRVSQAELKTAMEKQIEHLLQQTTLTAQSADELARALTHDPKYQGNWGERECGELLEHGGLRRGVEYDTQVNIKYRDADGKERDFRPDFILHLDSKRDVIIDAKVSLTAFKDYCNAPDEASRMESLKRHVASMESHVKELAEKDYASYIRAGKTINFVIMFVPITGALWTALQQQTDLWRKAMDRHVYIADEQTLFAALSVVKMTWTTYTQLEQYQEVFKKAEVIVERVGEFYERFQGVGAALTKAQTAYKGCADKLEDHGQSIIVAARDMKKLGVRASTKHPLPQAADVEDIASIETIVPEDN